MGTNDGSGWVPGSEHRGRKTDVSSELKKFSHGPIADTYDAKVRRAVARTDRVNYIRENYFPIQAQVLEWAGLEPGMAVLDIGVGTAMMWEEVAIPLEVHGIDISQRMLNRAASKGVVSGLARGHFLDIPFPADRFDRIVSTFAFHHVPHDRKCEALAEMARVLRPGGRIVIGDLAFEHGRQREDVLERMRREGRQDVIGSIRDEYYTDLSELRGCAKHLGFRMDWARGSTLSWVFRLVREETGRPGSQGGGRTRSAVGNGETGQRDRG